MILYNLRNGVLCVVYFVCYFELLIYKEWFIRKILKSIVNNKLKKKEEN